MWVLPSPYNWYARYYCFTYREIMVSSILSQTKTNYWTRHNWRCSNFYIGFLYGNWDMRRAGKKKQSNCPTWMSDALLALLETPFPAETFTDVPVPQFTPKSPGLGAGLDGCEIFSNSSGSHHVSDVGSKTSFSRFALDLLSPTRAAMKFSNLIREY